MANRSIKVKNYSNVFEEYKAAAAITPGMLIELASATTVQAHSSAGQNALPIFALENALEGEGISDAYAADDQVQCWIPGRGDQVNAILADGESVSVGDFLESDGNGRLQKHTADVADSSVVSQTIYSNQVVGQAVEAVDTSDSSGAESSGAMGAQRIKIRII